MKSLYSNQGRKIGKYACVSLDANDKLLVGARGWIFEAGKGPSPRLGVVIRQRDGDEKLSYHDFSELAKQVFRIKRFIDLGKQAQYANSPNLRG